MGWKLRVAVAAMVAMMASAGTALAGTALADLPAPGVLGLVALGVIAAIAMARGRK